MATRTPPSGFRLPSFSPGSRKKVQSRFDALVDRSLFAVVQGAESGHKTHGFIFEQLVGNAPPRVKARIATQIVDLSLRELKERLQSLPEEAGGNWELLRERLRKLLAGLTVATDDKTVFLHGDGLLREISEATKEPLLRRSRHKFEVLAADLGLRGEGGAYSSEEVATKELDRPTRRVVQVQNASRDLLSELDTLSPRATAAAGPPELPDPPKRYADYVIFKEDESGKRMEKLEVEKPLQAGRRYELEVAVRCEPIGLKPEEERKPFREPYQSGDVDIYVVVTSSGFEIPEPVQKLVLPPTGNSKQNARFERITPLRKTTSQNDLLVLEIRLFYKMNLLELVTITAEAVGKFDSDQNSLLNLAPPIRLYERRCEQEYLDFDHVRARLAHIYVKKQDGGYELTFTFALGMEDKGDSIKFPSVLRIPETEIENVLAEARRALLQVSVQGNYGERIEGADPTEFAEFMNKLARVGSSLWNLLFRQHQGSALWSIGEILKTYAPKSGAIIQISLDTSAASFVLPWNLLFDRPLPAESTTVPEWEGFWGLRYQIEQRIPSARNATDEAVSLKEPLDLVFLFWHFKETEAGEKLLKGFVKRGEGRVSSPRTIDSASQAYSHLENCPSHIVYFFSHGHTQLANAERYGPSEADFISMYDHLPKRDPLRKAWRDNYVEIKKRQYESDRSWIMLQNGKIYLDDLYGREVHLIKNPIVFLNMCESAQITPTFSRSFITFFVDRGARNVLGTECSMRPLFAHHFAKELFEGLLRGHPIGEVLLEVRRHFIQKQNPLGLAYTLFGTTTTKFKPRPFQAE